MAETVITRLTESRLIDATRFAEQMRGNRTFTHFNHTMPCEMLTESWRVWLLYDMADEKHEFIPGHPVFVGHQVIGWMQAQLWSGAKEHITRIGFALLEEYRGRGLGSMMVDYVLGEMRGKRKIEATVYSDNTAMLTIYFKRGFHVEGCFVDAERWDEQRRDVLSLAKFNSVQIGVKYD